MTTAEEIRQVHIGAAELGDDVRPLRATAELELSGGELIAERRQNDVIGDSVLAIESTAIDALEVGDRLHLAIYGSPEEAPFLVWGTVVRDDGEAGMGVVFDPLEQAIARRLERLVTSLPAVESLRDGEVEAMGTVMTEILAE